MDLQEFQQKMDVDGWVKVPNVYDSALIDQIAADVMQLDEVYTPIQQEAGVYENSRNAYHHTLLVCRSMLKLLENNPIHPYLERYFEGAYILNTMGASVVYPKTHIYTAKVHRDIRSFSKGFPLLVNTLICLDDSTLENGATWMLSGSHKQGNKPEDAYFYKHAVRIEAKKGDVLIFDGNIWHAAGDNNSSAVRRIITPIYTKPFFKQQLDYPRAFGYDFARTISPYLRQILGYNALVPTRLDEFYQPAHKRFYKNSQG
jgi:hypothetical protein